LTNPQITAISKGKLIITFNPIFWGKTGL